MKLDENLQTYLLISTAYTKLCFYPKCNLKAGLESREVQFFINLKSPNFLKLIDTLIRVRSGEQTDLSTDWVHNSVSNQILKTDLTQQMILKSFEIETNKTLVCKLDSDQKSHYHNFNWSLKWSFENTNLSSVYTDAKVGWLLKCKLCLTKMNFNN